jgi:hypothetical protein
MAAINALELAGMTPEVVYQKLQAQGITQTDASLLVSGWIYQNFGNVQRTFSYTVPFAAVDPNCAVATFARSFHHADWVDGSSVVQAQQTTGEDGFNLRFHRIENDIDGLAAEVAKLIACVAEMRSELHDRLEEVRAEINRIDSDLYKLGEARTGPVISTAPGRYAGLIESPNFVASTKLGSANVTLWQTEAGLLALPATVPLAGDPVTDQRVVDAADFGRLVASNSDITAAFGTTGLTKAAFVDKFGTQTTASGKTVAQILVSIPDTATFTTPQALADAVSQTSAASITSSTANLPGVLGVALGTTTANAANANVATLTSLTPETRTALAKAGLDTVGKLAAANPADVTTALKTVAGVNSGDVGAIISTAKTISFLNR